MPIIAGQDPGNFPPQTPNGDADREITFDDGGKPVSVVGAGNFTKTLRHNEYGEVNAKEFDEFRKALADRNNILEGIPSSPRNENCVPIGSEPKPATKDGCFDAAPFTNPLSGRARDTLGPDPRALTMPPAPGFTSISTAAEFTELQWMALLRDVSLDELVAGKGDVPTALNDIQKAYGVAIADIKDPGHLRPGLDLPQQKDGKLNLTLSTLFRAGLADEDRGPLVSQFFLHDIQYGTQLILQKQVPYMPRRDYLTTYEDWLLSQRGGKDRWDHGYPQSNLPRAKCGEPPPKGQEFFETGADGKPAFRRIATMRDLARFVNKDALHQAYFNAALLLMNWNAQWNPGNPYRMNDNPPNPLRRQAGFGTLGGPHILSLVSEVATRALKVVWFQKWFVHLRLRPEAYGGRMHMQELGLNGKKRLYGLPPEVFGTEATKRIRDNNKTHFLPMAFTTGAPTHPAYGAGHATVAGACVTVLKAWFDETEKIADLVTGKGITDPGRIPRHPRTGRCLNLVQPSLKNGPDDGTGGFESPAYTEKDEPPMTVLGELNKLAANVAMGRSMGGVHWRSDNTRSLRLGECVAIDILAKLVGEVAETPLFFRFTGFDNTKITITKNGDRAVVTGHDCPHLNRI